jgi:hypothetical protein
MMRSDRARKNFDRHFNYILAAYMASGIDTPTCRIADVRRPASRCFPAYEWFKGAHAHSAVRICRTAAS